MFYGKRSSGQRPHDAASSSRVPSVEREQPGPCRPLRPEREDGAQMAQADHNGRRCLQRHGVSRCRSRRPKSSANGSRSTRWATCRSIAASCATPTASSSCSSPSTGFQVHLRRVPRQRGRRRARPSSAMPCRSSPIRSTPCSPTMACPSPTRQEPGRPQPPLLGGMLRFCQSPWERQPPPNHLKGWLFLRKLSHSICKWDPIGSSFDPRNCRVCKVSIVSRCRISFDLRQRLRLACRQ
jgi:hypothetical protein